jgi:Zn finger protein HypA/HybF involved in hydrogenase expression
MIPASVARRIDIYCLRSIDQTMHDLHAADRILKDVLAAAQKNQLKNVKKIVLELGTIIEHGAEILPENLRFNIESLARGTLAAGAIIEIRPGTGSALANKEIEGDR